MKLLIAVSAAASNKNKFIDAPDSSGSWTQKNKDNLLNIAAVERLQERLAKFGKPVEYYSMRLPYTKFGIMGFDKTNRDGSESVIPNYEKRRYQKVTHHSKKPEGYILLGVPANLSPSAQKDVDLFIEAVQIHNNSVIKHKQKRQENREKHREEVAANKQRIENFKKAALAVQEATGFKFVVEINHGNGTLTGRAKNINVNGDWLSITHTLGVKKYDGKLHYAPTNIWLACHPKGLTTEIAKFKLSATDKNGFAISDSNMEAIKKWVAKMVNVAKQKPRVAHM